MRTLPLRLLLALLVWWAIPLGAWVAKRLTPAKPGDGVNMFGLTPAQHEAVLVGAGLGAVVAVLALVVGQLGWRWLLLSWGIALAMVLVAAFLPDGWVGSWWGPVLAVVPPVGAVLLTRPRGQEAEI